MFCRHCGAEGAAGSRFCGKCGKSFLIENSPTAAPAPSSPLPVSDQIAQNANIYPPLPSKNPLRKWLILSAGALVLLIGFLVWNSQGGFAVIPDHPADVSASANTESPRESDLSSTGTSDPSGLITVSEEQAAPAYLRINQVDSGSYDQGKVDVYFSLFADENLEQPLDTDQLRADMFKVDGQPVAEFAPVLANESVSVNLVLDKSGSMEDIASADGRSTKIDLVRNAATDFIDSVPSDANGQFAILSFSSYAPSYPDLPFTSNLRDVAGQLQDFASDGGETALYDSLTEALYTTNNQTGPKYIIAFTDGYDSGYGASAPSVIELSRQLGIPIYTIGFGDEQTALEDIAVQTGGQSYTISEYDDLQQELQQIYSDVFQRYTQQYKITYAPSQKVDSGQDFSLALGMKTPDYAADTGSQRFTRKASATVIDVQSGLSEYQTNYTRAVNDLDFGLVSENIDPASDFYQALKKRIEIDYRNEPKKVDSIQNAGIQSIEERSDQSYEIKYFKFFRFEESGIPKYEADLNTYIMKQDSFSSKWQVSEFARDECSIYQNENDPGSACGKGENRAYSGNPWTYN